MIRKSRSIIKSVLILFFVLLIFSGCQKEGVVSVGAVGITVRDMNRSMEFFQNVLDFEKISDFQIKGDPYDHLFGIEKSKIRIVRMRLGQEVIELMEFLYPKGRPVPKNSKSNDLWFQHIAIVVADMEKAFQKLKKHNVRHVSPSPQTLPKWNKTAGGIKAFYFQDPDGHNLEIIYFPPGKGHPRWQKSVGKLFLGIDHTAIVVSHTGKSLRLYRDILKLKVAGKSENYGPDQERLNNVFGARLEITGLKGPKEGLGVEFLDYISPSNGKPFPGDARPNDLFHWHISFQVENLENIAKRIREGDYNFISSFIIPLPDEKLGFSKALYFRDRDGHPLLLFQK